MLAVVAKGRCARFNRFVQGRGTASWLQSVENGLRVRFLFLSQRPDLALGGWWAVMPAGPQQIVMSWGMA